jgi:two-component system sensor histidine kinase RegB
VLAAAALNYLSIPLPVFPITFAVLGAMLLNLLTLRRLQHKTHVGEPEMFAQLCGDIAALSVLFYFSGGYTNPFVWMYLLPVTVAAVALSWRYVWGITALGIASYTALMFFYVPLSHMHMHYHLGSEFNIHLVGMWMGFVICALVIAVFVTRIGRNLREYDRLIADAREKALESERMLALGTLATAAAHDLGTPLSTMAVVVGDLADEHANNPELGKTLALLNRQITRCREILTSITASAGEQRAENGQGLTLQEFLELHITHWRDNHPSTQLESSLHGQNNPLIAVDRTLGQALSNLMDNAADASPQRIELKARWSERELNLVIRDFGAGQASEITARLGAPFVTTKPGRGMGIGLYLSRLIFERFGGTLNLSNHPDGGILIQVELPLETLKVAT